MVITRKDRRHSGRKYDVIYHPEKFPYEQENYDEWNNFRDGQRAPIDRSRIRPTKGIAQWFIDHCHVKSDNQKLKRKEKIRRLRQNEKRTKND